MFDFASFDVSFDDLLIISKITDRFIEIVGIPESKKLSICMDISAAHSHERLDLAGLLSATAGDIIHDVSGIRRYINRDTGETTRWFTPRYTKGEACQR